MSWATDDGKHEGWVAAVFADGMYGGTYGAGTVSATTRADGTPIRDASLWEERPRSEVVAWQPLCECGNWRGARWERVDTAAEQDLARYRAYSEDAWPPEEAEERTYAEWKHHIAPFKALNAIEDAAEAVSAAQAELTEAVNQARDFGASWDAIGRAAGMTRQSAHERWANR
ncbi:AsnC family protein [Nocardia sp. NPDC052001]|uniref:AsnC family protein n=1 Tax=Nocardia sp. NPDC052001 TaxID=3154853 RepID=UPI0034337534